MERKTQTGYLVLADISGYTSFVAQTEIEHAGLALSYLLETIVTHMSQCLTISKLEGDAVFAFCEGNTLPANKSMLDLIDTTYAAFRDHAQSLFKGATCTCRACQSLPMLDLKFFIHYGEFVLQHIAGIKDLLGTDVNLVHRLTKNHVTEATGWQGYALFTQPGLEHLQADRSAFLQQHESYEHLGDIATYVMELHTRYATSRSA